jgi:hypothetical protein
VTSRMLAASGGRRAGRSPISNSMARQAPAGLLGIHVNLPGAVPPEVAAALAGGGPAPTGLSEKKRAIFESLIASAKKGNTAYVAMMTARPQNIGYGVTDSPAGLAAWLLGHPGFAKWTYGADPKQSPTKDDVLDNITRLRSAHLLGERRTRRHQRGRAEDRRDLAPGGHHGIPGRGLSSPRDLGAARLSQPHLLQRSRQGRPLRGVGAARTLRCRVARRIPIASLI